MTSWDKQGRRRAWAALRRAGLRAVVTKALAGGLAAYLCVRERETLRLRSNCLAAGEARPALSWLGPEPGLPRRQLPAWGKTGLFARRFATYRVALSLHVAALARRRPQRPGCVAAALPARGNQRSQPRRGDGNGLARGAQGPAHDARQSPPGADSVLGGGETTANTAAAQL